MPLLQLTLKKATAVSASNSGAFVLELPVYDMELAQAQFSVGLGTSTGNVDGTYYECELFTTGPVYVPSTGVVCMLDQGHYSATRTRYARITVTFTTSLVSGSTYTLGFPGITVPSTSRGSDLIIYN